MIAVSENITLDKIDALYGQLTSDESKIIDIELPKELNNRDICVLFSLLQLGATWIRKSNSGKLILPIQPAPQMSQDSEKEYYSQIVFKEHIYPFIVLSWDKEIVDLGGNLINKKLKAPSQEFFRQMEYFELPRRDSIPVFCFDHDISKRGYSRTFYDINRRLLDEDSLDFNLFTAYQRIGDFFNKIVFRESIKPRLDDFNAIIHELFTNTHEHAKTNELGHNLYPNVRSVYLKFHKRSIEKFKQTFRLHKGVVDYFNSDFDLNDNHELYLFEISVLDSGPGLVKRYSKKRELDISTFEEVEIIKDCLFEHNTSSIGPERMIKGLGLARVLKTIDQKGFIRIRTGRVDVFRDMKNDHYTDYSSSKEIELSDWKTNSKIVFEEHPEVSGTLISIIYPLDYSS